MKALLLKTADKFGYRISRKSVWDNIHDFIPEATGAEMSMIETAMQYSMGTKVQMWSLMQAIKHIGIHKIQGDIVECGVWKGGNIILAGLMCNHIRKQKNFWAYDTYTGMSKPVDIDVDSVGNKLAEVKWSNERQGDVNEWCYSSYEEVEANFKKELGGVGNVRMVKGKVEDTLQDPENIPEKISLLRLDTDFYESTKAELEILYPKLQPGGVLIIDDYGHWKGARKAVDEYFFDQNIWLHRVDYTVRLMVKP